MAATKYTFSISEDFPNGKIASDRLSLEIRSSSIVTALDRIETIGDACDIWFKDAISSGDETTLDGLVASHSGDPLPEAPKSDSGVPIYQPNLPEGRRCDFYTPNFCDRTTWYQDSLRVENEVLVDNGSHQIFNLTTPCFVADLKHGKVFGEDELVGTYGTIVKVNDVVKTENKPGLTDGDFSINYSTGAVTFNVPLSGGETVKLTYSKIQTSLFKVQPPSGKKLRIGYVEVQFSKDIGLTDTLIFQLWGLADVFAPGQFPPGTMIPISGAEKYKTMSDFIADAEKAYPIIPTFGSGNAWRMMTQERVIFRFDYTQRASTDIVSSYGMEVRVWLENNVPFNGEYGVGTFYGIRVDE